MTLAVSGRGLRREMNHQEPQESLAAGCFGQISVNRIRLWAARIQLQALIYAKNGAVFSSVIVSVQSSIESSFARDTVDGGDWRVPKPSFSILSYIALLLICNSSAARF